MVAVMLHAAHMATNRNGEWRMDDGCRMTGGTVRTCDMRHAAFVHDSYTVMHYFSTLYIHTYIRHTYKNYVWICDMCE